MNNRHSAADLLMTKLSQPGPNPEYFSSIRPKKHSNLSVGQFTNFSALDGTPNQKSSRFLQPNKATNIQIVENEIPHNNSQNSIEVSPCLSSRPARLSQRKQSEGFYQYIPMQNTPEKIQSKQMNAGLLSKTLSPNNFKLGMLQNNLMLSPKAKNTLLSPKSSIAGVDESMINQQKSNARLVKQLRDAIKRTKQHQLEDQLNLEEQKKLETQIKNDLLPQMIKLQEYNPIQKNTSFPQKKQYFRGSMRQQYGSIDRAYSRQITNQSIENSPASNPKKNMNQLTKDEISIELLMILKFIQNKQEYLQTLKFMNKAQSIDKITDLLKLAIELDDIELFFDVMDMMVQTSIMFSDFKLALIILNMIKTTCELTHNVPKKIQMHRNYALICKKLGFYDDALRFLKKALQYIWLIEDRDQEIQIYDDLGLIFFHLVQLDQAKVFHEKSVQSFSEPIDNILREMSSRNTQKHINSFHPQSKNLDNTILVKLLQFPLILQKRDLFDGPIELHIENNYLKKNNLKLVKKVSQMSSQLSEHYIISQILQCEEFSDEISTPLSKPIEFSPLEFVRMKKVNDHFICIEEKEMKKGKSQPKFVLPKQIKKSNNKTFYLEEDKKKMDLEEKIKFRIKQLDLDLSKKNKISGASAESVIIRKENLEIINLGHLTTNRNAEAFTSAVSINYQLPNKFYDKMICYQFNKHNNLHQSHQFNSVSTSKERNS